MTFLFDPAKAMEVLLEMEKGWGGTPQQRMATKYRSYAAQYGGSAPKVASDAEREVDENAQDPAQPIVQDAQAPRPEPVAEPSPAATPSPVAPPAVVPQRPSQ
jgi:penicillin-binding protein 2